MSVEITEERDEDTVMLIIDEMAVDIHDDTPGEAVVYTCAELGDGDILSVEELRNLRLLIDEALRRLA